MSAILSTEDLNDFISPGVACIKPVETLPTAPVPEPTATNEVILDGQQPLLGAVGTGAGATPAQISLTDCLACSGCVTSAEAVLVSLQSHAEVLSVLDGAPALKVVGPDAVGKFAVEGLENEDAKLFVASVSPQTRANMAAACGQGVSEKQAGDMLDNLLRGSPGLRSGGKWNNGFEWVVDTNVAREATLVLSAQEVLDQDSGTKAPARPILASSCPGWVCYAEKTHPYVLPHLSKVKSPQALLGTMLKTTLSRRLGIPPERIWHLSVMPCFDKKLEASREELTDEVWQRSGLPGRGVRDVDCVITSKEILMLAESRNMSFFDLPKAPVGETMGVFPDPDLHKFFFPSTKARNTPPAGGSSGGLLHHVLKTRAAQTPGSEIVTTKGRNADVVEYNVCVDGKSVFRAARYYGFRNIQNLVRRLKPARPSQMPGGKPFGSARRPAGKNAGASLEYSYVEVMACPGGCTNGGGQIKVDDPVIIERRGFEGQPGPQEQKAWLSEVDEAYFSGDDGREVPGSEETARQDVIDGISHQYINDTLAYWANSTNVPLDKLALTSFREVISDVGKASGAVEVAASLVGKEGGGW
jgi:iron only hydrogenase large subunit-like protein